MPQVLNPQTKLKSVKPLHNCIGTTHSVIKVIQNTVALGNTTLLPLRMVQEAAYPSPCVFQNKNIDTFIFDRQMYVNCKIQYIQFNYYQTRGL